MNSDGMFISDERRQRDIEVVAYILLLAGIVLCGEIVWYLVLPFFRKGGSGRKL